MTPGGRDNVDPGVPGDGKKLGATLARQHPAGNLINPGVPGQAPAHPGVDVRGQDLSTFGQGKGIAANPRAQVDHKGAGVEPLTAL